MISGVNFKIAHVHYGLKASIGDVAQITRLVQEYQKQLELGAPKTAAMAEVERDLVAKVSELAVALQELSKSKEVDNVV